MIEWTLWGVTVKLWPTEVFLLFMVIGGVWVFWRATTNKRNPIDLSEMFVWPDTKHTSIAFFLSFWAGLISMWVIVDQELKGKLDSTVFIAFITTIVAGKVLTEGVNAWGKKPAAPPDDDCDDDPPAPPPASAKSSKPPKPMPITSGG